MFRDTMPSRRLPRLRQILCTFATGLALWPAIAGIGQVAPASQSSNPYGIPHTANDRTQEQDPLGPGQARRLEKMREDERRKRLEADTAKLVALTSELQAEVAKASKDELSLDVVRKAAEIEKLAHDVKERMKG